MTPQPHVGHTAGSLLRWALPDVLAGATGGLDRANITCGGSEAPGRDKPVRLPVVE